MPQDSPDSGMSRLDAVVELAAQGKTDPEIAETLGISRHTVDTYWKRLRQRWNASTRAEIVVAHLRDGLAQREAELERVNEELRRSEASLTERLRELQRGEATRRRSSLALELFERASVASRTVAYEIESVLPVVYKAFSRSAPLLGIDPDKALSGETTLYDIWVPEDHAEVVRLSTGAVFLPGERYLYIYRIKMPEPRWILDRLRATFDESGAFTGLVGMTTDIHDLVLAGIVEPKVRIVVVRDDDAVPATPESPTFRVP